MALQWEVSITEDFFTSFEAFEVRYLPSAAAHLRSPSELKKFQDEALALDLLITQVEALEASAKAGKLDPKDFLSTARPGLCEIQCFPWRTFISFEEPPKATVWSVIKEDEVS